MRARQKRKLWSVPKTIAYLVLFLVFSVVGAILFAGGILSGGGGGTLLGLALAILGPLGAIAATIELIRSALNAERSARSDSLDA